MKIARLAILGIIYALCVLGIYGVWTWFAPNTQDGKSAVRGQVESSDLTVKVTVAGLVAPKKSAVVTANYAGYINRLFVKTGDDIRGGDPIVTIAQTLRDPGQESYPIRAPFSGRVVFVNGYEGKYIDPQTVSREDQGKGIARIDDISTLYVDAEIPEIDVVRTRVGQSAIIRTLALPQTTIHGKIVEIAGAAATKDRWEQSNAQFPVRIEITGQVPGLLPGMSTIVDIILDEAKDALTLRHEFVDKLGQDYFVTTAAGERKKIEVGLQTDEAFQITKGVAAGEEVLAVNFLGAKQSDPSPKGKNL